MIKQFKSLLKDFLNNSFKSDEDKCRDLINKKITIDILYYYSTNPFRDKIIEYVTILEVKNGWCLIEREDKICHKIYHQSCSCNYFINKILNKKIILGRN